MSSIKEFDIAVVGGGISGLGVAVEAIKRGKKVCLVEKDRCGLAASNNSLRIIHGGLRYLQKLDIARVITSAADQSYCLKKWPDLIRPLRCVAPLSGKGLKRTNLARMAAVAYSCFLGALNSPLERPYVDSRSRLPDLEFLSGLAPHGFLIWQDALLADPLTLVQRICAEIVRGGGVILEGCEVRSIEDSNQAVSLQCLEQGGRMTVIHAERVVNCRGAWVGQGFNLGFVSRWCVGFNVILKRQFSQDYAFGADGSEGRYYFFVPRDGRTALGTGYFELTGVPDSARPSEEQIDIFIRQAAAAVPELNLTTNDIDYVEYGVLPMKRTASDGQPELFGSGLISRSGRVVHVLSTKYTTFRSQAMEVFKQLT